MEFNRTGIILYTINYQRCVNFYQSILGLTIMFETDALTCFQFGDSYLMVEIDDENVAESIYKERVKTCLRMNVPDVRAFADKIIAKNVAVDYQEHSWGTVAKFFDPDGNMCAFKDTEKFENQIAAFRAKK